MEVKVNYFGMIAEWKSGNREQLNVPENATLKEFRDILVNNCKELSGISYSIAINNQMADEDVLLQPNDDISVFPPFAGG